MNSQQQNNEEVTIDLRRLFILIKKHIASILVWTIGLGLIAYGVAEFALTPKYTATTQLLVNRRGTDVNTAYANQQADINAVTTYKDIITSSVVLEAASDYLENPVTVVKKAVPARKAVYRTDENGNRTLVRRARKARPAVTRRDGRSYNISADELKDDVSVTTTTSSQVFTLSATAETPEKSKAIANAVAKEFKQQITKIMDVNNVTIVAEATNGTQSFPNTKMITAIGLVVGLIISLMIIIIRDLSDTTVRDDNFMTEELGLINLGEVSHIEMPKDWTFTKAPSVKKNNNNNARRRV